MSDAAALTRSRLLGSESSPDSAALPRHSRCSVLTTVLTAQMQRTRIAAQSKTKGTHSESKGISTTRSPHALPSRPQRQTLANSAIQRHLVSTLR